MKNVVIYSYIFFFSLIYVSNLGKAPNNRAFASLSKDSCEVLIRPFLEDSKMTKAFIEVFEKRYLTKEEVSKFKESDMAQKAIEPFNFSFDEQNYAYAVMALIKKRYRYLDIESTIEHYRAIYKKC